MIRRCMDFLRVAVELASPVRPGSLVGEAGEGKGVRLPGACNAPGSGLWMDALSAPQPEDESLIDTSSPYRQSEKRTETEHRSEDTKKSGVTDAVQGAE